MRPEGVGVQKAFVVSIWAILSLSATVHAQTFDLNNTDLNDGETARRNWNAWFDFDATPAQWHSFQLNFVTSVGQHQFFEYNELQSFAREWHEMVLPDVVDSEVQFRMNQMESNGLFYMNNNENYAGPHRGWRLIYQAEDRIPFGLSIGWHRMPLQWHASGTTAAGQTVSVNSSRVLAQPLVEDFLHLRQIYNYYIPEAIEMAQAPRYGHIEVGLTKNLGDWVQVGVYSLVAPRAQHRIASWHEEMTLDLESPLFSLNPGADMSIPFTFGASLSVRYSMISFGLSQFLQAAPATPPGGSPLQDLQYGAFQLGYAF